MTKNLSPGQTSWTSQAAFASFFYILATLAMIDICVLEYMLKPLHKNYGVPWSAFSDTFTLGGRTYSVLIWHYGFVSLGVLLFGLVALFKKNFFYFAAGFILFLGGWEDILYYLFQLQLPPAQLPWLDANPLMGILAWIQGNRHVTIETLLMGNFISLIASWWLLPREREKDSKDCRGKSFWKHREGKF